MYKSIQVSHTSRASEFGLANVALINNESAVPATPEIAAKIKYNVPISVK